VVVVVGSAEQYGTHIERVPLRETDETRPLTHYAATKMAQEVVALRAFRASGLRVVCTRSFNHGGPGQAQTFLIPGVARRAVALPKHGGTLLVGNQSTVRDFLHVDDVIDAYLRLAERGVPGQVYNVSSGSGVSVKEVASLVLEARGIEARIETDPSAARAIDVPWLVGDSSRLRADTGWVPERGLPDIIRDALADAMRAHA
jgi:GDP-4-dehydro-6-deoxy-D-mannose reductase